MTNETTHQPNTNTSSSGIALGEAFFQYRDYTPIPLIILLLFVAEPSVFSAIVGTLIVVFGELIRIYSVAYIGSISRTRKNQVGHNLVTTGPFSWVRNPLYVGNFFICFGIAALSGLAWFVVLTALLFAMQYHFIVQYEENLLRQEFGDEYRSYCERVPAWVPLRLPKLDDIEWPDTFSKALKSEKRTLTAICVMLLAVILVS